MSRKSEEESDAKRRGSEPLKGEGMALEDVNRFRSFMTELNKNGLSIGLCMESRELDCMVWYITCASQPLHTQLKLGILLN